MPKTFAPKTFEGWGYECLDQAKSAGRECWGRERWSKGKGIYHEGANSQMIYMMDSQWLNSLSGGLGNLGTLTGLSGITSIGSASTSATITVTTPSVTYPSYYQQLAAMWQSGVWPSTPQWVVNDLRLQESQESPEKRMLRMKREAEEKARKAAAQQRAEGLLFTILTPAQVRSYKDDGHFEMGVNERVYRIRRGRSRNIELIEGGKATARFCAHPSDAYDIPEADVVLSQVLALQSDEAGFLKVANRSAA